MKPDKYTYNVEVQIGNGYRMFCTGCFSIADAYGFIEQLQAWSDDTMGIDMSSIMTKLVSLSVVPGDRPMIQIDDEQDPESRIFVQRVRVDEDE